jgi:hypothetical protein
MIIGYITLADILGWYLSVIGRPTTADAREENFFYPLLFLYTLWSCRLNPERSSIPSTTQITWLGTQASQRDVLLSSAVEGDSCHASKVALGATIASNKLTREKIRLMRRELVISRLPGLSWKGDRADDRTIGPQLGHCAETYPFLLLLG